MDQFTKFWREYIPGFPLTDELSKTDEVIQKLLNLKLSIERLIRSYNELQVHYSHLMSNNLFNAKCALEKTDLCLNLLELNRAGLVSAERLPYDSEYVRKFYCDRRNLLRSLDEDIEYFKSCLWASELKKLRDYRAELIL